MWGLRIAHSALFVSLLPAALQAQTPAKVSFADVQPVLRQNCFGCHGPAQQSAGLRLDRRSSVMGRRGVVPGSSENSFLFHRISGNAYGMQMPPTGALRPEQIALIKSWIDQGADWPDALANEIELPPLNPRAVSMVSALRTGDQAAFDALLKQDPSLLNARGPGGSTPFMYAVLYTGAANLERLIKLGANPNLRNDVHASALIWAATDLEKTRVLLDHGADVNAKSDDMRTPLMIAARRPGNISTVTLLLDRGANPNPNKNAQTESSPLVEAATAPDPAVMELLLKRGADAKQGAQAALTLSVVMQCPKCLSLLAAKELDKAAYNLALPDIAMVGDAAAARLMLDRGADVNYFDGLGRTPLMYAAASDLLPVEEVKLLIDRGADINAISRHPHSGDAGHSVLDIARLHGETPVVKLLLSKGAKSAGPQAAVLKPRKENSVSNAIQSSLPLIQKADANFAPKAACVSCHNNSLAAMTVSAARKNGFSVDEKIAAQQVKVNAFGIEKLSDQMHQGFFVPVGDMFGPVIMSYILIGLDAEHYPADINTDAVAMYVKARQSPDGQFAYPIADTRPPVCSDYIGQTALSMRTLQLYAPPVLKTEYQKSVQLAAAWMAKAPAYNTEDRIWRVLGLAWAGTNRSALETAKKELLAKQRDDGGWSDLDSMPTSVYATGRALYALQIAGMPATEKPYAKGVAYLLRAQQEDGSWFVKTRAMAFQPYFDAGFPHGYDQFVSAIGSSWATLALLPAKPASTAGSSGGK